MASWTLALLLLPFTGAIHGQYPNRAQANYGGGGPANSRTPTAQGAHEHLIRQGGAAGGPYIGQVQPRAAARVAAAAQAAQAAAQAEAQAAATQNWRWQQLSDAAAPNAGAEAVPSTGVSPRSEANAGPQTGQHLTTPAEGVRPRRPSNPWEAIDGLKRMGAQVVQPPLMGAVTQSNTPWDSLAGADDVKTQVEEVLVMPLKHPAVFASVRAGTRAVGTDRAAALLFYGPPGTGKTTVAKIAAAQAGLPLVYTPLEALLSKWYGKAEQQLAALFDHCQALGPCILFLDELDALAGSRSREMDEASRRMLSVLLRRLDGMEAQPETTLIAATNRRADLDAALLSRFDVRVHFPAPEATCRAEIFGLYAKHLPADERMVLAQASQGLSGRDLLDVCRQAERRWVCQLLKGEGGVPTAPLPLPPLSQYEASLRRRLESSSEVEDDQTAERVANAAVVDDDATRDPANDAGDGRRDVGLRAPPPPLGSSVTFGQARLS